ncbi:MAG: hypothetical protein D6719_10695 [Candidatus Dadabacteria bacterium]|nr:MAG: hypothetical protein D6719_10695 [Candidatus Dadabacteria bacterium]
MAFAFTPGLVASPVREVLKTRELPVPGEIIVKMGQEVKADQIVARAELPGELVILRVAEKLGIEPFEVMTGLKVKVGDYVRVGDLICEHAGLFGLFKSRYKSSVEGQVELITERTGHVAVRLASRPIEVDAYISGEVVEVNEGKSVSIKTRAAFIQGIFGVGGERKGILYVVDVPVERLFNPDNLPEDLAGKIIVSRIPPDIRVLRCAAEGGAKGFICGAVDDRTLAEYLGFDLGIALTGDEDVSMTVIITEGFGDLKMSERTFNLLADFNGCAVSINGATQVRAGAVRPEIVIPHDREFSKDAYDVFEQGLVVGAPIRIIRVPYFGAHGRVVDLPHNVQKIETGAKTRVLVARLEDGRTVTVPRANVELI